MHPRHIYIAFCSLVCLLLCFSTSSAKETPADRHIQTALRMVGHEVLLLSGDSSSRVLPISKEGDQYRISFSSEFGFEPSLLMTTVNRVMQETRMPKGFFLQVEACESGEIVYSYERYEAEEWNIGPCSGRKQPTGCYSLLVSLKQPISPTASVIPSFPNTATTSAPATPPPKTSQGTYLPILILLVVVLGGFLFLGKGKQTTATDPNLISLGKFQFDKRTSVLSIGEQHWELTGKEADLLLLLLSTANTTVEREMILQKVWGDEGHYVGRTLDVFISKLRKKLEADTSVKIVNIRGVGYKLVLGE